MEHNAFIEELSNKYGYDEELKIAIGITIPLMINHYGENRTNEIYDLFRNTRIFSTTDMSKANRDKIEQTMVGDYNSHLKKDIETQDPYQTNRDPGSYYSYQAIYDNDMNVIGEARWIAVLDMKNSLNGEDYKNTFGTTINMPYFIHEMGHAFGMQKATYIKEGDQIYSKHGMYEEVITYTEKDGKIEVDSSSLTDIMLEEGINEFDTQCMLANFFEVEEYDEVKARLNDINHVSTAYNGIIVSLAEKLEKVLGKDKLIQYRRDNDKSIIEEFNLVASQSDIAKNHCGDIKPFKMLDRKIYALFLLENKKYTMTNQEYGERAKELMMDGYAPLCAYQDKKYGTMSFDTYEEVRRSVLGIQPELVDVKDESTSKQM